ncbi:hypothetical protein VTN02DRAFT_3273 [Thermoascus thermophilus]
MASAERRRKYLRAWPWAAQVTRPGDREANGDRLAARPAHRRARPRPKRPTHRARDRRGSPSTHLAAS